MHVQAVVACRTEGDFEMQNTRFLESFQNVLEVAVRVSIPMIEQHIKTDDVNADVSLRRFATLAFAEEIVESAVIDADDVRVIWRYIELMNPDFEEGESLMDIPKILTEFIKEVFPHIVHNAIPIAWMMADGPVEESRLKKERARMEAERAERAQLADSEDWVR